jgi:hypothetical protein
MACIMFVGNLAEALKHICDISEGQIPVKRRFAASKRYISWTALWITSSSSGSSSAPPLVSKSFTNEYRNLMLFSVGSRVIGLVIPVPTEMLVFGQNLT